MRKSRHVIEIIGIQPITAVPNMPDHVIGVLNLRGRLIPIIDVRDKPQRLTSP